MTLDLKFSIKVLSIHKERKQKSLREPSIYRVCSFSSSTVFFSYYMTSLKSYQHFTLAWVMSYNKIIKKSLNRVRKEYIWIVKKDSLRLDRSFRTIKLITKILTCSKFEFFPLRPEMCGKRWRDKHQISAKNCRTSMIISLLENLINIYYFCSKLLPFS